MNVWMSNENMNNYDLLWEHYQIEKNNMKWCSEWNVWLWTTEQGVLNHRLNYTSDFQVYVLFKKTLTWIIAIHGNIVYSFIHVISS